VSTHSEPRRWTLRKATFAELQVQQSAVFCGGPDVGEDEWTSVREDKATSADVEAVLDWMLLTSAKRGPRERDRWRPYAERLLAHIFKEGEGR
jgi:hypothetical protein